MLVDSNLSYCACICLGAEESCKRPQDSQVPEPGFDLGHCEQNSECKPYTTMFSDGRYCLCLI